MHALLAHAYHLLLLPIHLAARPAWRSLAVCVAAASALRFWRARGAWCRAVPVIVAWAALAPIAGWPPTPVARLAGLGAIVLGSTLDPRARSWVGRVNAAALSAWWLRGAPLEWPGIAGCVPVFFGLAGGFAAADVLTRGDVGWSTAFGAVALAASLWLAGAAPHWSHAALAPACAATVLLGMPGVMTALARLTVCAAAAALVASDRGRVIPVDLACLTPLVVWGVVGKGSWMLTLARPPKASL